MPIVLLYSLINSAINHFLFLPVIPTYFPPCSKFSAHFKMICQQPPKKDFIKTFQKTVNKLQLLFIVHFLNSRYLEEH